MAEPSLCDRCGHEMIKECNGRTYFFAPGEGDVIQCPNVRRRAVRSIFLQHTHLGKEMVAIQGVYPNPLLNPEVDRTQENIFVSDCRWGKFMAYLKYVLTFKLMKERDFTFDIITDEDIKRVFVGAEAYRARNKEEREDKKSFNSLADLVREPELLIIRLGYLGYQNRAAAGALYEALLHRDVIKAKTWLIEERPWDESRSHNPEVHEYVDSNYEQVVLPDVEGLDEESEHDPVATKQEREDDPMIEDHLENEGPPDQPDYHTQEPQDVFEAGGPGGDADLLDGPGPGGGPEKKKWRGR